MSNNESVVASAGASDAPPSVVLSWIEAVIWLGIMLVVVRCVAWMYQFPEGGLGLMLSLACTVLLLALYRVWKTLMPHYARLIMSPAAKLTWSTRKKFIYALGLGLILAFGVVCVNEVQEPVVDFYLKDRNLTLIAILAPIKGILIFFLILNRDW